jgi:hypothetical protein
VKKHNSRKRKIKVTSAGIEPLIPTSEWPKFRAIDRAATNKGACVLIIYTFNGSKLILTIKPVHFHKVKDDHNQLQVSLWQ